MAGPPPSFSCICFLGDTSDGDTLLSPFGSSGKVLVTTELFSWTIFSKAGGGRVGAFV